ncbi:MAG: hypothetical protein ABIA92_01795 [Patescibacteria group bacterium]
MSSMFSMAIVEEQQRAWMDIGVIREAISHARDQIDVDGEYLRLRRVIIGELSAYEISKEEASSGLQQLDCEYGYVGPRKEEILSFLLHKYPELLLSEEEATALAQHSYRIDHGCISACLKLKGNVHEMCSECLERSTGHCSVEVEAI